MTQTDFADKYTSDKNERLLLHRLSDLLQQSEKNCTAVYSSFLDPAQAELAAGVAEFRGMIDFVGGYEGAERNLARFRAHEYCQETEPPIVLITAKAADKNAVISHRDVLGALMGLGIKREMTGDILPNKNIPQFFCHKSVSQHILLSLDKIGRYSVTLSVSDRAELHEPLYEKKEINVSSMRLDCIAAAAFSLSRTKAAEQIKKGLVFVNWREETDPSTELKTGDKLSMRGKGKAEVGELKGTSKKGRLFIELLKRV